MVGQRLSHYRIEEQIGAGGMGVVYRAHDEQLSRDVAIKVLPPHSLADDAARARFRKEALSLARLNHPNIATVHEFGSQDGTDFLVTEYIAGLTLDAKLGRGPLPAAEVIRLGVQMAAGLAAAHHEGVVHRDLKPGNLRLTTDGRLKILDFGLAQLMPRASEMGLTATLTQSQETSGTLPYMSPEQLSGAAADAGSDIWSAGAVLYEMATGQRPFEEKTPALLVNSILNRTPDPPSKKNEAIPASLDVVILRALARDPGKRQQSAAALGSELEQLMTSSSASVLIPQHRANAWISWTSAAIAVVLLCAAGGYIFLHGRQATTPVSSVNRRHSVAVLGFKNLSANPEKSWLSTALSEMLTTELSQGDQLRTIAGESVAQMKASLALPDAESFSQQTLSRIRQNLGSDDVVMGSYIELGDGALRLDVRLQDAVAGETLASVSEKGSEAQIDDLVGKVGTELRAKLGVGALSDAQLALVRATMPSNPEAARLYSQGLQKLRLFDALAARDLLEKAAALAPDHAPTHSALAEAWSVLGYDAKAKDQSKLALDLSERFSREERLLIEGRAHELLSEMPQAIESYRELWQSFPDTVDYGVLLIRAQIAAGRASDAESVLASLRRLTVSDADAARIEMSDAKIAASVSDFKRQQAAAQRAGEKARAAGATLLVAQGLLVEAQANERMGQAQKTIDLLHQARDMFISAGDRLAASRCELFVGEELYDEGDYEKATKQYEQALKVFQEIGARHSVRVAQEHIGNVYYSVGKLNEAKAQYEHALSFDRETNDLANLASDYGNIANALDGLGDLKGSLKMQKEALTAFNGVLDRRGVADTLNNLGNLFVEMGDLDEAKKTYDQALALEREINHRRGEPNPISGLGDVLFFQGDTVGARRQYEQSMALSKEMNDSDYATVQQVGLAAVALAEKRYTDGVAQARQAASAFEKGNAVNGVWANAILARNLLGVGDLAAAKSASDKAVALTRQATGITPRYEAVLAEARVKAKSGKAAEGIRGLEEMLASTRKFGYGIYQYQATLAIGEIEMGAGLPAGRTTLAALEKEAEARGVSLLAKQARELVAEETKSAAR